MNRILTTLILLVAFLVTSCRDSDDTVTGLCVRVSDGDTVTLQMPDGTMERIRLRGIDAPENGQDFGKVSERELRGLIHEKEVRLVSDGRDRYDRIIGKLYLGDLYVNLEMVRRGCAWYYPHYTPNEPDLQAAQDDAKSAGRGLWVQRSPLPPWEWRKMNRERRSQQQEATASKAASQGLFWVSKAGKVHNPGCKYYGASNSGTYTDKPHGVNCKACGGTSG